MIGLAPVEPVFVLLTCLIAWAIAKLLKYARPLSAFCRRETYRWTIADWMDTTFRIAVALATIRGLASL
jgi:hypothetical protein